MTRVLLVDDHALVRSGLAALLGGADQIEVVGEAADGREAVDLATRLRPDVVLMDLSMPVMDGVAATRQIAVECPGTHVVVLTSHTDRRRVREAMDAGASGYLVKDCEPHEIVAAVRSTPNGIVAIDRRVAGFLQPRTAPEKPAPVAKVSRWRSLWGGTSAPHRSLG